MKHSKIIKRFKFLPGYLRDKFFTAGSNGVIYIVEENGWVIKEDGEYIAQAVSSRGLSSSLDTMPIFYARKILHFGSLNTYCTKTARMVDRTNKIVVTVWHGDFGISDDMDKKINHVLDSQHLIDCLVVSTSIMEKRFKKWGFPESKLVRIPGGIDPRYFYQYPQQQRLAIRQELKIPKEAIVIGSFQKDGQGWGEGLEPKLIKGPDVFVEAVAELAKKHNIHCLLTGRARGFVKRQLEQKGVPYSHLNLDKALQVAKYYNALDMYIVASREEGGPKAIPESMATGVPLISTRVGIAPDAIIDGENGFIVDVEDVQGIVKAAEKILHNKELTQKIVSNALDTARDYNWEVIVERYLDLYLELQNE